LLDDALAEAKRKIREEAEAEERRRRAQVKASAQYATINVDPFDRYSRSAGQISKHEKGPRMPFGKHKGELIRALPASYLNWLAGENKGGWLGAAVEAELISRRGGVPRAFTPSAAPTAPTAPTDVDINRMFSEAMA